MKQSWHWGLLLLIVLGVVLFPLLRQEHYVPKPKGYQRIVLPAHEYVRLPNTFPYAFEVSKHAVIINNTDNKAEKYWINIHYPAFDAEIQLTYKPVRNNPRLLREYFEDAYKLTSKHQIKAYSIQEKILKTPQGHAVVIAELYGQTPSPMQFYTTDSTQHFLRGALYFNTATQNDYLAPVIEFIKEDIIHMIHTLEWSEQG
jgi:gliding motility-associated lipoprotein GldD